MNRGKRDIVAGALEKRRVVVIVGLVMRLSCRGTRWIVERIDCIEDSLFVVLMMSFERRLEGYIYPRDEFLE